MNYNYLPFYVQPQVISQMSTGQKIPNEQYGYPQMGQQIGYQVPMGFQYPPNDQNFSQREMHNQRSESQMIEEKIPTSGVIIV